MRQALGPGALRRPRGSGWRGRWEGGSGWGTHVNPWLFHSNVWQNSLQKKKKVKNKIKYKKKNVSIWLRWASQVAQEVKNPPANAGDKRDAGSIPGSGRSPGAGNGYPLQCSCRGNPMDRGTWWGCSLQGCTESDTPEWLTLINVNYFAFQGFPNCPNNT